MATASTEDDDVVNNVTAYGDHDVLGVCLCVRVCTHSCLDVCAIVYVCVHVCMYMCVCVCMCVCVRVCVWMCPSMYFLFVQCGRFLNNTQYL